MVPSQVYAKLIAVQFLRDGEAFGAGPTSAEGFGEEEVSQETVDSNSLVLIHRIFINQPLAFAGVFLEGDGSCSRI